MDMNRRLGLLSIALDGQDRRPDRTNILQFAVQARLQRSAKLHPEERGLLVEWRKGGMKESRGAPYRYGPLFAALHSV